MIENSPEIEKIDTADKYCMDCVFHKNEFYRTFEELHVPPSESEEKLIKCTCPKQNIRRSLVSGESRYIDCKKARSDPSMCGVDAKWYEPVNITSVKGVDFDEGFRIAQ